MTVTGKLALIKTRKFALDAALLQESNRRASRNDEAADINFGFTCLGLKRTAGTQQALCTRTELRDVIMSAHQTPVNLKKKLMNHTSPRLHLHFYILGVYLTLQS